MSVVGQELALTIYNPAVNGNPGSLDRESYFATEEDVLYMGVAMSAARNAAREGDSPIAAVLIAPGQDPFVEETREFRDDDLQGHAEMRLVQRVKHIVGRDLSECTMYSVAEPCYGCSYLLDKGGLGKLFIAATRADVPDFFTQKQPEMDMAFTNSRRRLEVVSGLMLPEAQELLVRENRRHKGDEEFADRVSGGA